MSEKSSAELSISICWLIIFAAVGGGLLGGASEYSCGVTLHKTKITTEEYIGTVYNFSVLETSSFGSNINYVFNNYLSSSSQKLRNLVTSANISCFLTVYDGPVYLVGQAYLLPINDTVVINYKNINKECFINPQTESCATEFGMTVAGTVLLSIVGFNLILICCFFSCMLLYNITKK